jgi:hypothetical protein
MSLIRIKRGFTAGVIPSGLTYGEPAVNTADEILYCGNSAGETINITGVQSVNGVTGAVTNTHINLENLGDVNNDNLSSEYVIAVDPDVTETHGYKSVSSLLGNYVSTFNGETGGVIGVSSVNGMTGDVAGILGPTGPAGSAGATGATGPVGDYVESFNGSTGVVDTSSMTLHVSGLSADAGITASQYNLGWTNIPLSSGSIDDGAMLVHDGDTDTMQKWMGGAKKTIGFFIDGDGAAIATGVKMDALTQVDQYWTIESVRLYCQEGVVAPDTTTISLYKTTDIEDSEANIESGATQLTLNGALTTSLSISNKSGTEYEKQTGPPTGGTYTLTPGQWIFPKVASNSSAQKIKIFVELKATTI